MTQFDVEPETRARAEALTQEYDERDPEYWQRLISKDGWVSSYGDAHNTRRNLPYAMAIVDVYHQRGCDWFHAPLGSDGNVLDYAVTVFSDEIKNASSRSPFNRQEDGNTYVYHLYSQQHYFDDWKYHERDYANLPGGMYKLEIRIPLFKLEKVVSIAFHPTLDVYRVSAGQYVYEHSELEAREGLIGLVHNRTGPGYLVWKLIKEATNIDDFYREMHRRAYVMNVDYEDSYVGFATDNTRPTHDVQQQPLGGQEVPPEHTKEMEESWEKIDADQDEQMAEDADDERNKYIGEWLLDVEREDSNSSRVRSRHDLENRKVHHPGRPPTIW